MIRGGRLPLYLVMESALGRAKSMLPLDDPRWNSMRHAYGEAFDVPELLAQIARDPHSSEPWEWLQAMLCHQGSVYEPAYAAVPHLVDSASLVGAEARRPHIEFVARVEACRQLGDNYVAPIPDWLQAEYFAAVACLPERIAECAAAPWDEETGRIYAGALLIVKGHARLGLSVQEFTPRFRCPECGAEFGGLADGRP